MPTSPAFLFAPLTLQLFLCFSHAKLFIFSPDGSNGKESACNAGDPGSVPGLGREWFTNTSVLAWRIPQTEEPSGLQSMGSQRVRHDGETSTHFQTG